MDERLISEDLTESCTARDWNQCKQMPCDYHGTCHSEAMLQPAPDES